MGGGLGEPWLYLVGVIVKTERRWFVESAGGHRWSFCHGKGLIAH